MPPAEWSPSPAISRSISAGRYTGPGRIVNQHPVIVGGNFPDTPEAVQYGMTAFTAGRRRDNPGVTGQRQGRPVLIIIRDDDGDAFDQRVLAERQQAVFENSPVQQFQVLFGPVRSHTPPNTSRRYDGPEIRRPRHGATTGSSRGVSGSRSWWPVSGLSIIW